jgi:hypothetical protein
MYLFHKYLFYSSQLTEGELETNKATKEKPLMHHLLLVGEKDENK